ncbi:ribonuclease Z [Nanoarchaeota archaeon]
MEIVFLGTAAMIPTKDRNHTGILISHKKESVLLDCGEGIQRQMKIAKVDINRIRRICISHWHGDHVLGLPGLIQTMAAQNYEGTLYIYGPKGSKKYLEHMLKALVFDVARINFDVKEVKEGSFYKGDEYTLSAYPLDHSTPCIGFSFKEKDRRRLKVAQIKKLKLPEGPLLGKLQQGKDVTWDGQKIKADDVSYVVKGKKIAYVADSTPCTRAVDLAKEADIMICESTHKSGIEEKTEEYKHMTSKQAAQLAHRAKAKKLILTHFSQRYKEVDELLDEAKDIFPDVIGAFDFMKVKV